MSELITDNPEQAPAGLPDNPEQAPAGLPDAYPRFRLGSRIEHFLLMLSFTVLAVTGLPQMFATTAWAQTMVRWMGGITTVRSIHHAAAVLLVLVSVLGVFAFAYRIFVRGERSPMFPNRKDIMDAAQTVTHNLGLREDPPKMAKFNFGEKFEYWAVIWGTAVMVITGFIMWNPIAFTSIFPGELIPIAKTAHGWEAVLAVSALVIWHMYNVHIKHFNRSIFTGNMSREQMEEEHALELERLDAGGDIWPAAVPEPVKKRRERIFIAVSAVAGLVLLVFIIWAFTFEQTAITTIVPTVTPGP